MKLTIFQIITIILFIAFAIYELVFIPRWLETLADDNPTIRTDLIIFPAILLIFVVISLVQFIKNKR